MNVFSKTLSAISSFATSTLILASSILPPVSPKTSLPHSTHLWLTDPSSFFKLTPACSSKLTVLNSLAKEPKPATILTPLFLNMFS
uniref:Uncharacterized protein n=1 Tax=uncultured marine virus TaxID=186617 RepID=A0A0F7LBN4_9VIRU|nr:hypothetical protein [uncultured marine virus]